MQTQCPQGFQIVLESADHCPAFKMNSKATPDDIALELDADLHL